MILIIPSQFSTILFFTITSILTILFIHFFTITSILILLLIFLFLIFHFFPYKVRSVLIRKNILFFKNDLYSLYKRIKAYIKELNLI